MNLELLLQSITMYVFIPCSLVIMSALAIKKWKQSKKNPCNIILSFFFLFLIFGIILNIPYSIAVETPNYFLYIYLARFSAFILPYSLVFIPFLLKALDKSLALISREFMLFYFISMGILCSGFLFLGEVYLSKEFVLRWDLLLAIYGLIRLAIISSLTIYYSQKILQKFKSTEIKKRFNLFLIGTGIITWIMASVILRKIELVSSVISSLSFGIGMILGPLLIYLGIGKNK